MKFCQIWSLCNLWAFHVHPLSLPFLTSVTVCLYLSLSLSLSLSLFLFDLFYFAFSCWLLLFHRKYLSLILLLLASSLLFTSHLLKWTNPGLFFVYFWSFQANNTIFYKISMWENVQIHDISNMSCHLEPLDQGSRSSLPILSDLMSVSLCCAFLSCFLFLLFLSVSSIPNICKWSANDCNLSLSLSFVCLFG